AEETLYEAVFQVSGGDSKRGWQEPSEVTRLVRQVTPSHLRHRGDLENPVPPRRGRRLLEGPGKRPDPRPMTPTWKICVREQEVGDRAESTRARLAACEPDLVAVAVTIDFPLLPSLRTGCRSIGSIAAGAR